MCDTWVATRGATQTQQVIFAKNSDRSKFDCQPLLLYPHKTWKAVSTVRLTYIDVLQVETTSGVAPRS